jgi:hypothetical protein
MTTNAALVSTVETLLADPESQDRIAGALTILDVTYGRTPEADPALVALYDLIDLVETPDLWLEPIRTMGEDSLALLVRLTEIGDEDENGLEPRRTIDVSAIGYLATLVNGSDFLLAAHVVPETDELPGLRALTRDISLTQRERSAAIFDLHPRAADLCSHLYAGGPALDDAERYYVSLSSPGDMLFVVRDRQTNAILHDHPSSEVCARLATHLNGPELAQAA